ncbi:MAG TPA: M23 family metallopeptidase, partial [Candidatus Saccharimonadales bacterium]|nr:M23 family metallopeptidase [Candidatus Saccharimonadales bacterium]
MKVILFFLLLAFVSCTSVEATQPPAIVINTEVIPTRIPTPTPVPSLTPTLEIPCNPFNEDFCIIDGYFILQRPVHPPANDVVDATYPYGSTANGTRDPHHGVEFVNPTGTAVHAAADGSVIFAGPDQESIYSPWEKYYGNVVVIFHEDEVFTLYAHLSRIDVKRGQQVLAGN